MCRCGTVRYVCMPVAAKAVHAVQNNAPGTAHTDQQPRSKQICPRKPSICPRLPHCCCASHPRSHPLQVVGKLRVRLSCLRPNQEQSADLPLLGERAKGARIVGNMGLTLQTSYDSAVSDSGQGVVNIAPCAWRLRRLHPSPALQLPPSLPQPKPPSLTPSPSLSLLSPIPPHPLPVLC